MIQYMYLLEHVLRNGVEREDRTGTGTLGVFGYQMRFDLTKGFPLLTTKKIPVKAVIHELLWFLSGSTNIKYLQDNGVTIWDEWADENGDLGPVYGKQWRDFNGVDQISELIDGLRQNPYGRRHIVTAWNPVEIKESALPPCHCLFQFHVQDGKLSCQLYQRSCDIFLGVPFNIASYALLTHMVAQQCGLDAGEFIWTGGDVHLYLNHLPQARLQFGREPHRKLPQLELRRAESIFDYKIEDFAITNYHPYPAIKAEVSV